MKNIIKIIILFLILIASSLLFLLFRAQATAIDEMFFHAVNGLSNPVLDYVLIPATYFGSIVLWIFLIALLWSKKDKKLSVYLIYALIINSSLLLLLKGVFMRPRPLETFLRENFLVEKGAGYSFPSGHAENAFSGATVLSSFYEGGLKVLFYALAILTGISRIYIGIHYPLDVLFGSLIGLIIGNIVLNLPTYETQEEIEKIIYGVRAFLRL